MLRCRPIFKPPRFDAAPLSAEYDHAWDYDCHHTDNHRQRQYVIATMRCRELDLRVEIDRSPQIA
jgi:hypothetical protein